jgi:hypothetical protein
MAQCAYCKAETEMYVSDVPICIECSTAPQVKRKPPVSEHEIRDILHQHLLAATEQAREASEAFTAILADIPSGIVNPDGTQRIHNASRQLSVSRMEMMKAHNRLNDYLARGITPEDLKKQG